MKTILFFGDSNTWGYDARSKRRFSDDVRFTGLIAQEFPQYRIVEEGMKGRTNAFDDRYEPDRNGQKFLPMILCTHDPIELFVIMLGTNDVKTQFNSSAAEIAEGLDANIRIVQKPQQWGGVEAPKILVVCPPGVTVDFTGSDMEEAFDKRSAEISLQLDHAYRQVAKKRGCYYLNARDYTGPCVLDGVHLDVEGHRKLAAALSEKLRTILE